MTLLSVENLTLAFPGHAAPVVEDVSFAIDKGEMLALVGESGSGKSVTALSLMRLHPPGTIDYRDGRVLLDGQDTLHLSESTLRTLRGKRVGYVFQEPMTALNPLHTIGRQLREAIRLHRRLSASDIRSRVESVMHQVGLEKLIARQKAYPHQLSGGERQRVMIAMAIMNEPDLLIADEPTTALDVTLQAQVLDLLKDLQTRLGVGILLITHDLTLVRRYADRVAILQKGRLVETGPAAQVLEQPQASYTQKLLASAPSGAAVPLPADSPVVAQADGLSVRYVTRRSLFGAVRAETLALAPTGLTIRRGETLGLVGESGSGKTTLGLALARLIQSEGSIVFLGDRIDGRTLTALRPIRQKLQFVFQDPFSSLNPRMSVGEIIAEGLRVHRPSSSRSGREEAVADILAEVGLDPLAAHRYPHEFSGGQRQRINLARAMILEPALVILDEPTSALDLTLQSQILALLKRFQETRGTAYLFVTHDLRVIRSIAHRVAVLKDGKLVEEADTEALFDVPREDYTKRLLSAALLEG